MSIFFLIPFVFFCLLCAWCKEFFFQSTDISLPSARSLHFSTPSHPVILFYSPDDTTKRNVYLSAYSILMADQFVTFARQLAWDSHKLFWLTLTLKQFCCVFFRVEAWNIYISIHVAIEYDGVAGGCLFWTRNSKFKLHFMNG